MTNPVEPLRAILQTLQEISQNSPQWETVRIDQSAADLVERAERLYATLQTQRRPALLAGVDAGCAYNSMNTLLEECCAICFDQQRIAEQYAAFGSGDGNLWEQQCRGGKRYYLDVLELRPLIRQLEDLMALSEERNVDADPGQPDGARKCTLLARDAAGNVFSFDPGAPDAKMGSRSGENVFHYNRLYFAGGQWYHYSGSPDLSNDPDSLFALRTAGGALPPARFPDAPNYARHMTRRQARDWFLAADLSLPEELAELEPADGPPEEPPPPEPKPRWDGMVLWFGEIKLRDYQKKAAPQQAEILEALEKAGWPSTPVAVSNGETLHATLRHFNEKLKPGFIKLQAGGDGKSVFWTPCPLPAAQSEQSE